VINEFTDLVRRLGPSPLAGTKREMATQAE